MSTTETIYVSPKYRRLRVNLESARYERHGDDKVLVQGIDAQFEDGLFRTADPEVIKLMDAHANNVDNGGRAFFSKVKNVNQAHSAIEERQKNLEQREAELVAREKALAEKESKMDRDEADDEEALAGMSKADLEAILVAEAEAKGIEVTAKDKKTIATLTDAILRVREAVSENAEFDA